MRLEVYGLSYGYATKPEDTKKGDKRKKKYPGA
jgi:hypothetical protein